MANEILSTNQQNSGLATSSFDENIIRSMVEINYDELAKRSAGYKAKGLTVGLILGTFDVKNVGHDRYFMFAKEHCKILIVGVESDAKIKQRKGTARPVVLEEERLEQVCHVRWVDVATLDEHDYSKYALHKAVQPDVLIISTQTVHGEEVPEYSDVEIAELQMYCKKIIVVKRQAQTSATARIRMAMLGLSGHLSEKLSSEIPVSVNHIITRAIANEVPALVARITDEFLHKSDDDK